MTLFAVLSAVGAHAATVDFSCLPDAGGGRIVGVPPLTVHCQVEPPPSGTWEEASWTLGDGTVLYGDSVSYQYTEIGQYNVSVRLDGFVDPDEPDAADPEAVRYGFVTVCGAPEPAFTYVNHGDLDFEAVNLSPIRWGCTDALQWDLFRGTPAGDPVRSWETWEPRFELEEEGPYTLRLTMYGLAGSAAAELRFDAVHKLTDDLTEGPRAMACATGPVGSLSWLAGTALVAALRRRSAPSRRGRG